MTRVALALVRLTGGRAAKVAFVAASIIHPLVHGTPLDGGWLDAMLQWSATAATTGGES